MTKLVTSLVFCYKNIDFTKRHYLTWSLTDQWWAAFLRCAILQLPCAWKHELHAEGSFCEKKRTILTTIITKVAAKMRYVRISCTIIHKILKY